jgi:hypothetical protein
MKKGKAHPQTLYQALERTLSKISPRDHSSRAKVLGAIADARRVVQQAGDAEMLALGDKAQKQI